MLVASAQATTSRLQGKARYRKSSQMLLMMPAGSGELGAIKDRTAFGAGDEGDEEWYAHVSESTEQFAEGHRATSTAREHEQYMANISDWVVSVGFAPLVERAYEYDGNRFGGLKAIVVDGRPRVMRPENS